MFTAALFTTAKMRKQPKCPLMVGWIKKMWYVYTMEYYSASFMRKKQGNLAICKNMDGPGGHHPKGECVLCEPSLSPSGDECLPGTWSPLSACFVPRCLGILLWPHGWSCARFRWHFLPERPGPCLFHSTCHMEPVVATEDLLISPLPSDSVLSGEAGSFHFSL